MIEIVREAARRAGGVPALASKLGVSRQAVYQWELVPLEKVDAVSRETGLARSRLRPDIFSEEHGVSEDYDVDFAAWANRQARLLRSGDFNGADIENIADEVEDMARSQKRALSSNMIQVLCHKLKWQFQPEKRTPSWEATIFEQRRQLHKHLADSPSLKAAAIEALHDEYPAAARLAGIETRLGVNGFPTRCPYTIEQVLDFDFLPSADPEPQP